MYIVHIEKCIYTNINKHKNTYNELKCWDNLIFYIWQKGFFGFWVKVVALARLYICLNT